MSTEKTEIKHERPTVGDMYDSLTWHDETAIENAFHVSVHDLMGAIITDGDETPPLKALVALVRAFELVRFRRDGRGDVESLSKVRLLTNAEINDLLVAYFDDADEPEGVPGITDELADGEPVTPAGEGGDSAD